MELSKQKKSRGITQNGEPNPIDIHVGKRLRLRRLLLGLSQDRLGQMIGLTFQQIQKYENGTNRISASRLWDIAVLLEVPISFFFEDMDQETFERSPRKLWGNAQLAALSGQKRCRTPLVSPWRKPIFLKQSPG